MTLDAHPPLVNGGDQSPVAEIAHCFGRNGIKQLPPLLAVQHRRLAGFLHMLRPAHGGGRVMGKNLASDQPVEQHADTWKPSSAAQHERSSDSSEAAGWCDWSVRFWGTNW